MLFSLCEGLVSFDKLVRGGLTIIIQFIQLFVEFGVCALEFGKLIVEFLHILCLARVEPVLRFLFEELNITERESLTAMRTETFLIIPFPSALGNLIATLVQVANLLLALFNLSIYLNLGGRIATHDCFEVINRRFCLVEGCVGVENTALVLGHAIGRLLVCALLHHSFAFFGKFNLFSDCVKANSVCSTCANLLNLVVNLRQFFLQFSLFFTHGLPILLWWKGLVEFGKSDRNRIEFLLNFCTLVLEVVKDGINIFLFEEFNKIIILLFALRDVFD